MLEEKIEIKKDLKKQTKKIKKRNQIEKSKIHQKNIKT